MRILVVLCFVALAACTGRAWNTTVADNAQVRAAMVGSVVPGSTTEKSFVLRWGKPTQVMREGGQKAYIYRNMSNPEGYYVPQFGNSQAYVIVVFQYGLAVGAYSSDSEGCRATFGPRPTGPTFDNPSTVHTVNCGVAYDGSTERRPIAEGLGWLAGQAKGVADQLGVGTATGIPSEEVAGPGMGGVPTVTQDTYSGGLYK